MKQRRTREQTEQLERQILAVLAEDHPQSVRHVFYRMTDPRLPEPVGKDEHGYKQVQNRIKLMRRGGRLRFGWISDTTRRGWFTNTFDGAGDFLDRFAGLYRGDLWANTPYKVEVWVESRSIAGVLQAECQRLAVPLYPCGGFPSMSYAYEAAQEMNHDGRPVEVLFVGDYDPAGLLIDLTLERELRQHVAGELRFRRLAINEEQISLHDLPMKPRKATETRLPSVLETVEAEAMPAATLRAMVAEAVEGYLPAGALESIKVVEAEEREGLRRLAGHLDEHGIEAVNDAVSDL